MRLSEKQTVLSVIQREQVILACYTCAERGGASHEKHHKLVPRITVWDARYVSNVSCGRNLLPCLWASGYKVRV
jgi:hypothetical protein